MLAALMAGAVAKVSVDTLPDNGPTNITDDNDVDGVADGRTRAYGVVKSAHVGGNISIVLEAGAAGALPPDRERVPAAVPLEFIMPPLSVVTEPFEVTFPLPSMEKT